MIRSPLGLSAGSLLPGFTADSARVLYEIELPRRRAAATPRVFERAGPREMLFFEPAHVTAGILTAGGVCPGINDVVRSLVLELRLGYGVERVLGFRFGFGGLDPATANAPVALTNEVVREIHTRGGTFLGTSRGICPVETLADGLLQRRVDMLFAIGGDGTMRAAHSLYQEVARRGTLLGIVGVPKTIDNDIPFVDKTFGFDTAVAMARVAIDAAHAEARSVDRGIGLVKLMGRHAGFIAAQASLASHDVNACLIPEVPFDLEGDGGLLAWLERRLEVRHHAVLVVAEGCAEHLIGVGDERDASGNIRFGADTRDIGRYLKREIESHFTRERRPVTLKYIDPSYMVRAVRPTAEDAVFCDALARNAVHAAMAGKTDVLVGRWHRRFTHVPLEDILAREKRVEPSGELWRQVIESTGQPSFLAGPGIDARRTLRLGLGGAAQCGIKTA